MSKKLCISLFAFCIFLMSKKGAAQIDTLNIYIEPPTIVTIHTEVMTDMLQYFNKKKQEIAKQDSTDELVSIQRKYLRQNVDFEQDNIFVVSLSLAKFILESSQSISVYPKTNPIIRDTLIRLKIVNPKQKLLKENSLINIKINKLSSKKEDAYYGLSLEFITRNNTGTRSIKTIQVKPRLKTTDNDPLAYQKSQTPFESLYYSYTHSILLHIWNELTKYGYVRKSN